MSSYVASNSTKVMSGRGEGGGQSRRRNVPLRPGGKQYLDFAEECPPVVPKRFPSLAMAAASTETAAAAAVATTTNASSHSTRRKIVVEPDRLRDVARDVLVCHDDRNVQNTDAETNNSQATNLLKATPSSDPSPITATTTRAAHSRRTASASTPAKTDGVHVHVGVVGTQTITVDKVRRVPRDDGHYDRRKKIMPNSDRLKDVFHHDDDRYIQDDQTKRTNSEATDQKPMSFPTLSPVAAIAAAAAAAVDSRDTNAAVAASRPKMDAVDPRMVQRSLDSNRNTTNEVTRPSGVQEQRSAGTNSGCGSFDEPRSAKLSAHGNDYQRIFQEIKKTIETDDQSTDSAVDMQMRMIEWAASSNRDNESFRGLEAYLAQETYLVREVLLAQTEEAELAKALQLSLSSM